MALTCRALQDPPAMLAYKQMQLTHASTAEHPLEVAADTTEYVWH
jgi:hypothetical protein